MVVFEQKMSAEQPAVPQTRIAGMRYYVQSQIARTSLKPNCSKRKMTLLDCAVCTDFQDLGKAVWQNEYFVLKQGGLSSKPTPEN